MDSHSNLRVGFTEMEISRTSFFFEKECSQRRCTLNIFRVLELHPPALSSIGYLGSIQRLPLLLRFSSKISCSHENAKEKYLF